MWRNDENSCAHARSGRGFGEYFKLMRGGKMGRGDWEE